MTREEKIGRLITYLKEENPGYAAIQEPVNEWEKRRLLRTLMNVRWPGEASEAYYQLQDALLQEELEDKGVVRPEDIPVWEQIHPDNGLHNPDRISLWQGDITRLAADAIVNAANSELLGCFVPCHGCIDNAIHSAAGIQLRNECARLMKEQGCAEPPGRAKITGGYNLPARFVIHTVGPVVGQQVIKAQEDQLRSCYQASLRLAEKHSLKSIAFCCISTGEFHFPNKQAAKIAVDTVDRYLNRSEIRQVIFDVYKTEDYHIYSKILQSRT